MYTCNFCRKDTETVDGDCIKCGLSKTSGVIGEMNKSETLAREAIEWVKDGMKTSEHSVKVCE